VTVLNPIEPAGNPAETRTPTAIEHDMRFIDAGPTARDKAIARERAPNLLATDPAIRLVRAGVTDESGSFGQARCPPPECGRTQPPESDPR
jgi:hypothetical protein